MRSLTGLLALAFVTVAACSPTTREPSPQEADPSLIVFVVVDQLRGDLLDRYDAVFTGGLRTLLDNGMVFDGASHRHARTTTAVGHATLSTGVVPSRHGLAGNTWTERRPDGSLVDVYAVADSLSPILGLPEAPGRSPANLMRDGLADWVRDADSEARIVSLSTKDRAAIPMAGRAPGHVYWISPPHGRFVTSVHYRDGYPGWVEDFNRNRMPSLLGDSVWRQAASFQAQALARPDPAPWEGDGVHTVFPHRRAEERPGPLPQAQFVWSSLTPAPDRAVVEFAALAVEELDLGQRGAVDFLALSLSQSDYVGHDYGPLSHEQLENLIHLDQVLGSLLEMLDERVGEDRWVLGLSADHGVMTTPEWLQETGLGGRRLGTRDVRQIRTVASRAAARGGSPAEVRARVASAVEAIEGVARVYGPEDLQDPGTDTLAALFAVGLYPDRRTGLLAPYGLDLLFDEAVLLRPGRGTTHGTPYWHDRHVPFILFGTDVPPGRRSDAPVYSTDMAPALAALAGIPVPPDLDGRVPPLK